MTRLLLAGAVLALCASSLAASPTHRHRAGPLLSSDQCVARDGDTLSCKRAISRVVTTRSLAGGVLVRTTRAVPSVVRDRLRLNGIDAPELKGHCRAGRVCVAGDALASKANLAALIAGKTVQWRSLGRDRWGRTIAQPTVGGVDLGCEQMKGGFAQYWARYDNFSGEAACAAGLPK